VHYRYSRWVSVAAVVGASVLIGSSASAATGWTVVTVPQTGNNTLLLGAAPGPRTTTRPTAATARCSPPLRCPVRLTSGPSAPCRTHP